MSSRRTHPKSRTGVRVNRRAFYVHVESATVRDTRISYRAMGLLTYLLDQTDDWQVRSEQLSQGEGREGRDAVRKALHELAAAGYYRLERRRFRDGKQSMGTAVSEFPVPQWADDYKTFGEDLRIPVIEQPDGSFLVRYPDGTLGSDGFETTPDADTTPDTEADEPQEAKPEPEPEPEPEPAPVRKAPPAARRATQKNVEAQEKKKAEAQEKAEKAARKKELDDAAAEVAAWWWEDAAKSFGPYVGAKGGFIAMRKQVHNALEKGYTKRQCADALRRARKHWPSAQQWQDALGIVAGHIAPGAAPGSRAVPYNDEATWGKELTQTTTDNAKPGDDDVQFGIVPR